MHPSEDTTIAIALMQGADVRGIQVRMIGEVSEGMHLLEADGLLLEMTTGEARMLADRIHFEAGREERRRAEQYAQIRERNLRHADLDAKDRALLRLLRGAFSSEGVKDWEASS